MDEMVTWFRRVLDEDEAAARNALEWFTFNDAVFDIEWQWIATYRRTKLHNARSSSYFDGAPTPAVTLADIEAKRAILDLFEMYREGFNPNPEFDEPEYSYGRARGLYEAVQQMAYAYRDRPGYRDEWRP